MNLPAALSSFSDEVLSVYLDVTELSEFSDPAPETNLKAFYKVENLNTLCK